MLISQSTVSKILRQKEKYMNPQPKEEESASLEKRSEEKLPHFEKTLANWARNQQRKGLAVTDDELQKQAGVFAFSRGDRAFLSSSEWLGKFKDRNQLNLSAKGKKPTDSSTISYTDTLIDESSDLSSGLVSPSMSATDYLSHTATMKGEGAEDFLDLDTQDFDDDSMQHGELLELPDAVRGPMSPEMDRSPDTGIFDLLDDAVMHERSQMLSDSTVDCMTKPVKAVPVRSVTSSSDPQTRSVDPSQTVKRHKSVPDIDTGKVRYSTSVPPPPSLRSTDTSPIGHPSSPVQDDNIRALHTIKELLQQNPDVAEPDDYFMIGKLMEKLKVLRSPHPPSAQPGGMHAIVVTDSPRLSKKRTNLDIST